MRNKQLMMDQVVGHHLVAVVLKMKVKTVVISIVELQIAEEVFVVGKHVRIVAQEPVSVQHVANFFSFFFLFPHLERIFFHKMKSAWNNQTMHLCTKVSRKKFLASSCFHCRGF